MIPSHIALRPGARMPILGFGTWKLQDDTCVSAVKTALETGYRHIDTADRYGNHRSIARAMKESGIPRSEIFITTKVWHSDLHHDDALSAGNRFLDELETDYVDLLLIHWPNAGTPLKETLEAFGKLKESGVTRDIGVSNFTTKHIDEATALRDDIAANQIEFHPSHNQEKLRAHCERFGIATIAYSPIAQGADLEIPLIRELAAKYGRSPSQVCLNWINGKGIAAIPGAANPEYIQDNFATLDWELSPEDAATIDALGLHNRINTPAYHEFGDEL